MIQVYSPTNTEYEKNGDMTLFPKEALVQVVLNGSWGATLYHPIDKENRWKYLEEEAVVKMPSFNGDQLFRIRKAVKKDSGIACTMEPIFYDSIGDCFLEDIRPTQKNGQEALDIMLAPNAKYSAESDITKTSTAYYEYKNFMEALNGDIDQSFINRWGGEILFDNYTVKVNEKVGGDYGVEVLYGKNIKKDGFTEEVDTRDVITRIYPVAFNGRKLSAGFVDSENIDKYPTVRAKVIKFETVKMEEDIIEGTEEEGVTVCSTQEELDEALLAKCQEQFEAGIDKPKVTISADMVLLQNTTQYEDYKVLEEVSLGDTIHCRHSKLGIVTDARVIELEYDSIRKKVTSVVLGDYKYDYFDDISSSADKIDKVVRPNGTVMAEKVLGILNAMNTQLKYQKDVAQKQDVRAVLFEDLDPDSNTYGAMCLGTQGFQISNKRTEDDKDWDWTTAATANGILADSILTGLLTDKTGKNYWNLDTGELRLEGKNLVIKTDNLNLDENGNLSISGKYEVEYTRTYDQNSFTEEDATRAKNIIIDPEYYGATQEEIDRYDLDGSGLRLNDVVIMRQLIAGNYDWVKYKYKITIDPSAHTSVLKASLTRQRSEGGVEGEEKKLGEVRIGGAGIYATEMATDTMDAKSYKTTVQDITYTGITDTFTLSDGTLVRVVNGIVVEMNDPESEE